MKILKKSCKPNFLNSRGNHPLLRSMSVDCLQTASNGRIVSENWLKGRNRIFTLKCLHDENDNQVGKEIFS